MDSRDQEDSVIYNLTSRCNRDSQGHPQASGMTWKMIRRTTFFHQDMSTTTDPWKLLVQARDSKQQEKLTNRECLIIPYSDKAEISQIFKSPEVKIQIKVRHLSNLNNQKRWTTMAWFNRLTVRFIITSATTTNSSPTLQEGCMEMTKWKDQTTRCSPWPIELQTTVKTKSSRIKRDSRICISKITRDQSLRYLEALKGNSKKTSPRTWLVNLSLCQWTLTRKNHQVQEAAEKTHTSTSELLSTTRTAITREAKDTRAEATEVARVEECAPTTVVYQRIGTKFQMHR